MYEDNGLVVVRRHGAYIIIAVCSDLQTAQSIALAMREVYQNHDNTIAMTAAEYHMFHKKMKGE